MYSYQSADGTQRQESGGLKYPAVPGYSPVLSIQGSYSSITPEGINNYFLLLHNFNFRLKQDRRN